MWKEGIMMKKEKEMMDIVFLLDRSGSMSGMESDTIGGFNGYLENRKNSNAKVTTVLFDDRYEMITERENISKVKKLDNKTYYTRGSTALLDAIGKTIKYMDEKGSSKVLFIITTDGYENSSIEYSKKQVKELIQGHSQWEFIYLGADIDSYSEASSIGIRRDRTSNYTKSKKGMGKLFDSIEKVSKFYEEDSVIAADWKEGLEDPTED